MNDLDLHNQLQLSGNEKLLWTGKPKAGLVFRSSDIYLVPFSLMWCGFAIFWETGVVATNAPFFFKLWGIPFVLVGLYITVGRFFLDAKKRAHTLYGITEDRIIIRSGIFRQSLNSLNIRTISDIALHQKADRSGTITLGPADLRYAMMQGMEWPGAKQPPRLELIEDVKSVYDKIIELQKRP